MNYSKEKIIKEFEENGYKVISEENDIKSTKKTTIIDRFGYKYFSSLTQIKNNKPLKFNKSNPYTIENIKTYLKNNSIETELVSNEYLNNSTKMIWKCKCGKTFERSTNNVIDLKQYYCKECGDKIGRDKHRRKYEDVKKYIESKGWILLDKEYKEDKVKLSMQDKDGYKIKIKYSTFKKIETYPKLFDENNPYTTENIKTYLKINNISTKLISNKYFSATQKLKWECECGEIFERTWNNVYSNNQIRCVKCSHNSPRKHNIEVVKKIISNTGCKLLSEEYYHNRTPLKIQCSCGEVIVSTLHDFLGSTHKCKKCLREHKRIISAKKLSDGLMPKTLTIPHKMVNTLLNDLRFNYEIEKNYKYYSIDTFVIDYNIPIEIMGDYWHLHPLKYEESEITKSKRYKIKQDLAKNTYLKKYHNQNILYLWEDDIINNLELCRQLILLYIKNKGELLDYQSYNYHLTKNSNIRINKIVIDPYFITNKIS